MAVLDSSEIMFRAFEPKVQNRFIMYMADTGIQAFMVRKASPPKFTDPAIKLDHINTYRKIRGKREWGDVDFTLYDPIIPSAAVAVMEWARLSYESVTGRAGYSDFYKKDIVINMLGPVGDVVSEWVYKGAFVVDMDPGALDWSNQGDPVDLTIKIAYDYGVLNY